MKSIIPGEDDKRCFICQKYGPEHVHHCLHGPYRWLADKYGLTVHLCVSCHMLLHDKGRYDRELEALAQELRVNIVMRNSCRYFKKIGGST